MAWCHYLSNLKTGVTIMTKEAAFSLAVNAAATWLASAVLRHDDNEQLLSSVIVDCYDQIAAAAAVKGIIIV
jgi:hypothetical protein